MLSTYIPMKHIYPKTVSYILLPVEGQNMLFISDKIINDHNKKVNDRYKNIFSCHLSWLTWTKIQFNKDSSTILIFR